MAARRRQKPDGPVSAADQSSSPSTSDATATNSAAFSKTSESTKQKTKKEQTLADDDQHELSRRRQHKEELTAAHLPPLPLVLTVLVCSGFVWVLALRDVMATGRVMFGSMDHAMLTFTKSTDFFDDSRGWKSQGGGLSSIASVTTDENNMGGLFVRKISGAAALAVHSQKLWPLLFHPDGARWTHGHFNALLLTSIASNVAIVSFYLVYMEDLAAADANGMGLFVVTALLVEAMVMLGYLLSLKMGSSDRRSPRPKAAAAASSFTDGKGPRSLPSRIVARTVTVVSTLVSIVAVRDLFFPGTILMAIPRDDIYLEWTGAFLHSPPPDSPEMDEHGLEAPLYVGEKFVSQLMGLYLLLGCLQKIVSGLFITLGNDGTSGLVTCRMFWKVQAVGGGLILFMLRLFAPSAGSASLDLRWHLMCIGYEAFILGIYGFF